jgi:hypothetical protein
VATAWAGGQRVMGERGAWSVELENILQAMMMRALLGRSSSEARDCGARVCGRSRKGPLSASKSDKGQVESRRHEQLGK